MNRIVIITGATGGIGLAAARKFKDYGDIVIAASRDSGKVRDAINKYALDDGFVLDVTDFDAWMELKAYVMGKYGRVDVLVNAAGAGISVVDAVDQTRSTIDAIVTTNLTSVLYGCQLFGEVMKAQCDGVIVNLSDLIVRQPAPGWSVYAAAKAGVQTFTRALYAELQPYGVRATCILPGSVATGFQLSAGLDRVRESITPDDVASAIFYAACQPAGVEVEELTVRGTSQVHSL